MMSGHREKSCFVLSGILCSQVAGLIVAVLCLPIFSLDHGPLYGVQQCRVFMLGENALHGFNFEAVAMGMMFHLLVFSLFWGVAYGLMASLLNISTPKRALFLGILVGFLSLLDVYYVTPVFMVQFYGLDIWAREVPRVQDWFTHLAFGVSFIFFPEILHFVRSNRTHYHPDEYSNTV